MLNTKKERVIILSTAVPKLEFYNGRRSFLAMKFTLVTAISAHICFDWWRRASFQKFHSFELLYISLINELCWYNATKGKYCYYNFKVFFRPKRDFQNLSHCCSRSAKKICRQISVDADIASLGKNIPNTFHLNSIFKCSNT